MEKVYITGDNEKLKTELTSFLSGSCEVAEEPDSSVNVVFEITNFDREIKFNNLKYIEDNTDDDTTVVSSSLCITVLEQLRALNNPARLMGIGLYPSFSEVSGIELTGTKFTAREDARRVEEIFKSKGKDVFQVEDRAGMVSMRVITLIINEAYQVLQEGTSNRDDIDTAMKLGTNYPFGPIEWSERIGLDLVYNILDSMYNSF